MTLQYIFYKLLKNVLPEALMIKYIKFGLVLNTSHSMHIQISMRIKLPKIINFLVPSITVICTHGDGDIMFWLTLVLCMSDGYEITCVDIWYITRIEARVDFLKHAIYLKSNDNVSYLGSIIKAIATTFHDFTFLSVYFFTTICVIHYCW